MDETQRRHVRWPSLVSIVGLFMIASAEGLVLFDIVWLSSIIDLHRLGTFALVMIGVPLSFDGTSVRGLMRWLATCITAGLIEGHAAFLATLFVSPPPDGVLMFPGVSGAVFAGLISFLFVTLVAIIPGAITCYIVSRLRPSRI